ncbi:hypothetical protein RJ639_010547 [Escallonia herrerae]|uniref:Uncharacterized protein n=1 Tax=Escallonia herrerae TaxID=1293975 RepID=A0AA89ARR7_9ASTE|nr:hypothetical protein RJ639_010547 [Escallonia herrerae]
MAKNSIEQNAAYEKWECSNRISLMIMKWSITTNIHGAIPDSNNVKLYLVHIEKQFQGSSKAHATTLITKMVTLKYNGSRGVREHILRIDDMASQLKGFDMKISEEKKWKMSKLISMCVQVEERLKSEQPNSAQVAITGSSKGKGKKFGKGSMQGNKIASVTKTDKTSSSVPRVLLVPIVTFVELRTYEDRMSEIQRLDHVSIPVIQKVGAPLPHIEDNDAPEVVPNDVPPIMDPAPIPANEQPLRRLGYHNVWPLFCLLD